MIDTRSGSRLHSFIPLFLAVLLAEESIDRLRKLGAAIDELPIWPFDPGTLRKFAMAQVTPVLLPLISEGVRHLPGLTGR